MNKKVLGISSGPRRDGNSDTLLKLALEGAASAGAETEYIWLPGMSIGPCLECNACYGLGKCRLDDDYQEIFGKLIESDRLIFATPVFFMGVCAQGKLMIDRCQCLWARRYVLKQPLFPDGARDRRGMVIAVGGSKSRLMFDSVTLTMKYFFDALEMRHALSLYVNRVDAKGDILKHGAAMEAARRMGAELVSGELPEGGAPREERLVSGPAE
ncbi:MAG TPA: flavodoxin family protein [Candidatus Brocadiia bacterium]|nr:flavodoxin family protein [Candidatus Brocadiia bacterium]